MSQPISSNPETPVVVILIPESNDPIFVDIWQFPYYDILAAKFEAFDVRAIAAPWMNAPFSSDSLRSFTYTANLAWDYPRSVDKWDAWLRAWPKDTKLINSPSHLM